MEPAQRTLSGWRHRIRSLAALGGNGVSWLVSLASLIRESVGWKRYAIAFMAGLFSVLAFAPFFVWPVLFLTLPALVWLLDAYRCNAPAVTAAPAPQGHLPAIPWQSILHAAYVGWAFGFGFFSAGLFWIGEAFLVEADKFAWALPIAVTLLPAGLALFFAFAAALACGFWRSGVSRILLLAAAIGGAEWLRGHVLTGLPWNVIGYALTAPLELMQAASLFGIYGLTIWTVIITAVPLVIAVDANEQNRGLGRALAGAAASLVLLVGLWGYGASRLSQDPPGPVEGVRVRVVQPSVPQQEKWRSENQARIFADHLALSNQDASGQRDDLAGITHLVWPEAAMPFLPLEHPQALARIGELLPGTTYLVTGALRRDLAPDGTASAEARRQPVYNSLLVFAPDGSLSAVYDKIHLVPFGEYLPFQHTLEAIGLRQLTRLRGGFAAGSYPRPLLDVAALKSVAGLICYEAIFPQNVLRSASRPNLFINVTNDGWFGNTTGPRQHFHQARVRAVETGVPLLRAANNGFSAMIGPNGRVIQRLDLDLRGVFDTDVPHRRPPPAYALYGDWIFLVNLIAVLAAAGVLGATRWL